MILSEKAYHETLREYYVPKGDRGTWVLPRTLATVHGIEKRDGSELLCLVCLDTVLRPDLRTLRSSLTHEGVHVWQNYCDFIGESEPSREFEAYSIQMIAEELQDALESSIA